MVHDEKWEMCKSQIFHRLKCIRVHIRERENCFYVSLEMKQIENMFWDTLFTWILRRNQSFNTHTYIQNKF